MENRGRASLYAYIYHPVTNDTSALVNCILNIMNRIKKIIPISSIFCREEILIEFGEQCSIFLKMTAEKIHV